MRDGGQINVRVVPEGQGKYEIGDIGILPMVHPQVADLNPGEPAAEGGLRPGDVDSRRGNGEQNIAYERLIGANRRERRQTAAVADHARRHRADDRRHAAQDPAIRSIMGAHLSPFETRTVDPGPWQALQLAAAKNWEWTTQIVQTLVGLFTRETSVKQLMGPVAIADLSGSAAQAGWIPLFSLMAMISLNLGLINLMPIPVLDGGHIFILGMEGLARRDFSMKVKEKMLRRASCSSWRSW